MDTPSPSSPIRPYHSTHGLNAPAEDVDPADVFPGDEGEFAMPGRRAQFEAIHGSDRQ